MITSYFMAQTFVPVLANWVMKGHHKKGQFATDDEEVRGSGRSAADEADAAEEKHKALEHGSGKDGKLTGFEKFRNRFLRFMDRVSPFRAPIAIAYILLGLGGAYLLINSIGRDVLPKSNSGQFQVRLRAPDGTRIERTEEYVIKTLHVLNTIVGHENIELISARVGMHGGQYPTNRIYLFRAGPRESVLQVTLKEDYKVKMDDLKKAFGQKLAADVLEFKVSFEPIELT